MRLYLVGLVLLAFLLGVESRSRRWRRQVLPSQHVQVQSFDSIVTYNKDIFVESTENRIDIKERTINGSIWSDHSLLHFDSLDTFANVSADNIESFLTIANGANLHGQGVKSDLYLRTNRTQAGNTAISQSLSGSANFSIEDEALRVQAVNGREISLETETWQQRSIEPKMTLNAESSGENRRELRFEALDPAYHLLATYAGSTMFISFAGAIIRLDNDYRNVEIFTDKFNVTVITRDAPYEITLTQEEVIINLPTQRARVCVTLEGVIVKSNQVAKTHIEKNNGTMTVGGQRVEENGATIIAGSTNLNLSNAGQIIADLSNTRFYVDNNIQKSGLTSAHMGFTIDQGFPNITVDTGESCLTIVGNHGLPNFTNVISPFTWPEDKFVGIGPFGGNQEAEYEFLNKPSCCYIGVSGRPQTGSGQWSEWGNNGNNGGGDMAGQGSSRIPNQGAVTRGTTRTRGTLTTHAPQYGQWPTFSPDEDVATRRAWPESFNTGSTAAPGNWEDNIGCNCHSTLTTVGQGRTTLTATVETIESSFPKPEEPEIQQEPFTVRPDAVPRETEEMTTVEPSSEATTTSNVQSAGSTTEEEMPPTSATTEIETATDFPMPDFETLLPPTNEEESTETAPQNPEASAEGSSPTTEDFTFAQYPSTLFPPDFTILATISTVQIDRGNQQPNDFPPPADMITALGETTAATFTEIAGEWAGGASDIDTSTIVPEEMELIQPILNNTSVTKRSLMLKLLLPENVVGRKVDSNNIREGLQRFIRSVALHKIIKRDTTEKENFLEIESIEEHDGKLEIVFKMADNEIVNEKELLSMSNQEMSKFFEFPVISLTRLEELGDNRLLYILVALGLVLMSLFCLCYTFQSIVKRMSEALLVSAGRRFNKYPPGEVVQYQSSVAPC